MSDEAWTTIGGILFILVICAPGIIRAWRQK